MDSLPFEFDELIDARAGVIRGLYKEQDLYNDEPKLATYRADVSPTSGFSDGGYRYSAAAGGRDLSESTARLKAFFEGVERYCLSIYRTASQRYESYAELHAAGERALDPADFVTVGRQSKDARVRGSRMFWVKGRSLGRACDTWVPAQAVYLPYRFETTEQCLRDPVTTGAAAGLDTASAVIRAVLELVERDALMLRHYAQLSPLRLDPAAFQGLPARALIATARRYRFDVEAFHMTVDIPIHVVAVRLRDRTGLCPATVLGSKADADLEQAFCGAFLEAATFRRQLRDRGQALITRGRQVLEGERSIESLEDRAALWALPDLVDSLPYLDDASGGPVEPLCCGQPLDIDAFVSAVIKACQDVVVVDVTTPDVARYGIVVVRAVAPRLQWMHLSEDGAAWSSRLMARIRTDINRLPHPYV